MGVAAITFFLVATTVSPASASRASRGGGAIGAGLRGAGGSSAVDPSSTPADIHEKWDQMDEFLKAMFTLSCKWKHGKDVNGLAAEKVKNGDLEVHEVAAFKEKVRADNLQGVTRACGLITANGKQKCRQGCADRWGNVAKQRHNCDESCIAVYARFETSCRSKAENLEKVYRMKSDQAAARTRCRDGFCGEFPTVWMKTDVAGMTSELDKLCAAQCTAASIEVACSQKWQLELDFVRSDVKSTCFEQGQVKTCFDGKRSAASTAQTTCSSTGKQTCEAQFNSCKSDGKVDETFKEANEFCSERKKMCEQQVVEHCLKEFKSALESGQKECEGADTDAAKTCETEQVQQKQQEMMIACTNEKTPKCPTECKATCPVDKLDGCLSNLKNTGDATKEFCEDFWDLLHDSAEVDPVTGNPIVLLVHEALTRNISHANGAK
eukprot:TRINITY_DN2864_c0_g1_i1.p1 TRINITY_DN2864_c0_g1~~TRINITY_DN2864_c0_g1_i1.p1  ORF type:complete len:437 (+),score=99.41 TRINITY_DN2864_c0_g1_i1:84-1394(+)